MIRYTLTDEDGEVYDQGTLRTDKRGDVIATDADGEEWPIETLVDQAEAWVREKKGEQQR